MDRASALAPGSGSLDLFGYAEKDRLGGGLEYQHHITQGLAAFAQGWAGTQRDALDQWRTDYGAVAGLRWSW